MIGRSAPLSLTTICGGVPAGATTPAQVSRLKPLIPASSMVGRSGNSVLRRIRDTAMGRTVPALTCGMALVKSVMDIKRGERAVGAGTIFDNHRLAERGTELVGDDPADRVAAAAGAEDVDDGDGARWIIVGVKRGAQQCAHGGDENKQRFSHV